jgi:hypothetical protein
MENTFTLSAYTTQANRIISKLDRVRKAPPKHEVFGSSSHKYKLFPVETEANLIAIESAQNFVFPDALRAFFLLIGSGPNEPYSHMQGGAGPFYGIAAARTCRLIFDQKRSGCHLHPDMDQAVWQAKAEQLDDAELFTGLLVFGTQGCSFDSAIVLEGEFAGRVLYIDHEHDMTPIFCSDANFLEWYERWLDEILAGYDVHAFGEHAPGNQQELQNALEKAINASDNAATLRALNGFHKFRALDVQTISTLRDLQCSDNDAVRARALHFLLKFDAKASYKLAVKELSCAGEARLQTLCSLRENEVELNSELESALRKVLESSSSATEVVHASWMLGAARVPYGNAMLGLTRHDDALLRALGVAGLGSAPDKKQFRDVLVAALGDVEIRVNHAAVQSLKDLEGIALLEPLSTLARKHPTNQHYILTNILHRLKQIGPTSQALVTELACSSDEGTAKEAYQLLYQWGELSKGMPKPHEFVFGLRPDAQPKKSLLARFYEWMLS